MYSELKISVQKFNFIYIHHHTFWESRAQRYERKVSRGKQSEAPRFQLFDVGL